ncbi:hypothetical protein MIR68_009301 [Amoeboaphelidium protococcarum]|nr:hypothetical protein MIR68_009301 [Amoeboaphelidium protococcarum]
MGKLTKFDSDDELNIADDVMDMGAQQQIADVIDTSYDSDDSDAPVEESSIKKNASSDVELQKVSSGNNINAKVLTKSQKKRRKRLNQEATKQVQQSEEQQAATEKKAVDHLDSEILPLDNDLVESLFQSSKNVSSDVHNDVNDHKKPRTKKRIARKKETSDGSRQFVKVSEIDGPSQSAGQSSRLAMLSKVNVLRSNRKHSVSKRMLPTMFSIKN